MNEKIQTELDSQRQRHYQALVNKQNAERTIAQARRAVEESNKQADEAAVVIQALEFAQKSLADSARPAKSHELPAIDGETSHA